MKNRNFTSQYNKIEKVIPFDTEWKNGTGYLDYAVYVSLKPGERAKSYDDYNRRIILIGTNVGPIVVFDRHSDNDKKDAEANITVVLNKPRALVGIVHDGALSDDGFSRIVGISDNLNLGSDLNEFFKAAQAA